ARAFEACEESAAVLKSEGDLEGLADAWLLAGKVRYWGGDALAAKRALPRAAACARQGGNHHVAREARTRLVPVLQHLPIPFDIAAAQAERLLEAAPGGPGDQAAALRPRPRLYGHAG